MVALSLLVFVSCSKNDDEYPQEKQVSNITTTTHEFNSVSTLFFEYDKKGRVVKSRYGSEDEEYNYNYDDNVITETYTSGSYSNVTTYHLNKGIITHATGDYDGVYTYSAKNELLNYSNGDGVPFTYTWKNGNIITQGEGDYIRSYTYSTMENQIIGIHYFAENIPDNILFNFGYFGAKNKNLPTSKKSSSEKIEYEYEFDEDGYVTKMQTYVTYDQTQKRKLTSTQTIEYK